MKKILFASTALVASAGFAAADISFSGEAGMGFIYDDATSNWSADYYTTLSVSMTGETDGGLGFGADFDITTAGTGGGAVDTTVVYIEGGFGKFSIGDVDNAIEVVTGLSDIGYSGLGTDNLAEDLRGDAMADILYNGTFGDFTVALSYDMNSGADDWAIGAKYAMGDYSFALGYDEAAGINAIHVQAGATIADFSLAALYSTVTTSGIDYDSYGVTAAYTMGAVTVTAAYSATDIAGVNTDGYGLGVSYDLGGGASVEAGVGEVAGATVADLGIVMLF